MKVIAYWDIVGSFYQSDSENARLIIVAMWAPNLEDIDALRYVELYLQAWYDIIVPEYYWYCRSWGIFTPANSIQTLLDTKNIFTSWSVKNIFSGELLTVKYENIYFVWMSYGAGVVAMLAKYDSDIKNIALIYPVLSYQSLWKIGFTEESGSDFKKVLQEWYSQIYRGIELPIWEEHFQDLTEYIPEQNIDSLKWVNIFLSHGTLDTVINNTRTKKFHQNIRTMFPENTCIYKEYIWWHDDLVLKKSIEDIILFFDEIKKYF
jgi:dienelactone hydrolase